MKIPTLTRQDKLILEYYELEALAISMSEAAEDALDSEMILLEERLYKIEETLMFEYGIDILE